MKPKKKVNFTIDPDLVVKLKEQAKREERSASNMLNKILREALK
tara:strand:+ start:526 stop:657 length:132 start_codon:yes stop_codon:yes gene_type:complete